MDKKHQIVNGIIIHEETNECIICIKEKARTSESNLFKKKLNQKDKIIQDKDRAYSKEIRDLNLTIENLRRYETKRVLEERQRIKKELEKFGKKIDTLGYINPYKNKLVFELKDWKNFWERIKK